MTYGLLLWPHANQRYAESAITPAKSELQLILSCVMPGVTCEYRIYAGMPMLAFESDTMTERQTRAVSEHSLMYWLAEILPDGLFRPIRTRADAYLGADLAGIQKYKGKTNELFTQMLINLALYSSDFCDDPTRPIRLYDPMCGRGTTLFQAVNRGWNAVGADLADADIAEASAFLKRYLEYHRVKHAVRQNSRTVTARPDVKLTNFEFADTPEHMKTGDFRTLSLCCADGADAARAFGRGAFQLICADLPYGVQHAPKDNHGVTGFERLLSQMLPSLRLSLARGGAIALSFNANTLKTASVRALLAGTGFTVCEGGLYDSFAHWVEQAVTRDVAVAVKQ